MRQKQLSLFALFNLVLTLLLAACGGGAPASQAAAQNIAVVAFPTELPDYDPSTMSLVEPAVMFNVYQTLTFWTPNKGLIPQLATSWEANEDGSEWTFKLRQGVKFHDGSPFNAEAVKGSIERTIEKEALAYVFQPISTIEVVDDYTIKFSLEYPLPLADMLSNQYGALMISPAAWEQEPAWFRTQDAGTGPYMIESHEENQRLVLTRFDDYWGGWQEGQFSKVIYEFVEDSAVREQMIRAGEADLTFGLPEDNYAVLADDPNITVDIADSFQTISLHLNTVKPPLNDIRVRQALAHTFPREQIAQAVYAGYGKAASTLVPGSIWGSGDIPTTTYAYDLDKARALLAEAGLAGGFDLYYPYTTGELEAAKPIGELWKAELDKLNINLEIVGHSYDALYGSLYDLDLSSPEAHDVFPMLWWPGYVSPHEILAVQFASYAVFPTTGYNNQAFDTLVDEALSTSVTDPAAAQTMFLQADQQLVEQAVAIPVLDVPSIIAYRSDIQGFRQNPNYSFATFWYELRR